MIYDLSVSENYVKSWGITDAVREIVQNSIDQEVASSDNHKFIEYSKDEQTLRVGNRSSVLDVSTLLLGETTKEDDDRMIGHFGEGYKVAALVLSRNSKILTIFNYGKKETWAASIEHVKKYKRNILRFRVNKKAIWDKVPDNNLVFEVKGITEEEYKDITEMYLGLKSCNEVIECNNGTILMDEEFKGRVYVGDLYVSSHETLNYGYNFKPGVIKLDRDRKLTNVFELLPAVARLWLSTSGYDELIFDMLNKNYDDVKYLDWYADKKTSNNLLDKFTQLYGEKSAPFTIGDKVEDIAYGYKPVAVSSVFKNVLANSENFKKNFVKNKRTLRDAILELESSIDEIKNIIPKRNRTKIEFILKEITERSSNILDS